MDADYFLSVKFDEIYAMYGVEEGQIGEEMLYENIENIKMRFLFSFMQRQFDNLLRFLNRKFKENRHYNAVQSRELINVIQLYRDSKRVFSGTEFDFNLDENYEKGINFIFPHLSESGGSEIPLDFEEINLKNYEAIFSLNTVKKIDGFKGLDNVSLKLKGTGSYAVVHKYKDPFYGVNIAVKKARNDLSSTELLRFKKEYELMKQLDSPYIVDVYRYDEINNEFYMEFMPFTLKEYIMKNNSKLSINTRKSLVNQIFFGLRYIHSKGKFHRDLSVTNIMIKPHDDGTVIAKILDFGYFKNKDSDLTKAETVFQGSLNDPYLRVKGFKNYGIQDEIFAFTQLIFFVMTGREKLERYKNDSQKEFLDFGMNGDLNKRAKSLDELQSKFKETEWN